ncbi:protein of unknown function DUF433 [Fibrisoma limi BUZ 3]|uniref:DUF433 domain-containing protein n=1 Tax=Fibrisoma limi BUZ 3 TaxID=1185876 RepID=I2GN78_9BACT|nr:DUF433 domain-containing protein [Fibrisoma limi]CCH55356.1 protein of unknown function DUF433 [Fibrisoma limi BUZ 3]
MNWQEYIVADDTVLSGKPTIKGTRLSVEFLLERLADGWTEQDLLDNYPRLTKEALQAMFAFVHANVKDNLLLFPAHNLRRAS